MQHISEAPRPGGGGEIACSTIATCHGAHLNDHGAKYLFLFVNPAVNLP